MLKKTQKSQNLVTTKKSSIKCSLCKNCSPGTAFYICDSGHLVCENCRQSNDSDKRKDSGDCLPGKKRSKHTNTQKNIQTKSICALTEDLASGDHDKCNKTSTKETKSKNEGGIHLCKYHVDTKNTSENKTAPKEKLETIIEYKNSNYTDDRCSTSSLLSTASAHNLDLMKELPQLPDHHVCPRWYNYFILEFTGPVQCPVEACKKMIALDSVMLHFYFDHSKVPRMTLSSNAARRIYLKSSNLSAEAQCLCIFSLQEDKNVFPKVSAREVHSSECKSILLMGAKLQLEKLKHHDEKSSTIPISVRNITTQTELQQNDIAKNSTNCIKKCETYRATAQTEFDNNEILLLWLCKQNDKTDSYSISVLSRDKQGFSYIGGAIHIRNEQSPADMFRRADCLMVPGTALNRMLDEKNHICVVVNFLG